MINLSRFGTIGQVLENRNYVIYMSGATLSWIGTWVQRIGIGWLVWELTESATWLGVIAFANLFPVIVISPLAGVFADRLDRLTIIKLCQSLSAAQAVTLTVLTFTGLITIWIILSLVLFVGAAQAFYHPGRQALLPSLVRHKDLPSAIALSATAWHTSGFIGPALAGIIIVSGGVAATFAFNSLTYIAYLTALWKIKLDAPSKGKQSETGMGGDLMAGLRYVFNHRGIGPLLVVILTSALLTRPITELLPGFAEGIFGQGPEGLSLMAAASGFGAMVAGLWLSARGTLVSLTKIGIVYLLVSTFAIVALAVTPSFTVAVACMVIIGFALLTTSTTAQTLIQSATEHDMLGRVFSLFTMFYMGGTALGALGMGTLGSTFGLRAPIAIGALLCLFVWLWAFTRRKTIAEVTETV